MYWYVTGKCSGMSNKKEQRKKVETERDCAFQIQLAACVKIKLELSVVRAGRDLITLQHRIIHMSVMNGRAFV